MCFFGFGRPGTGKHPEAAPKGPVRSSPSLPGIDRLRPAAAATNVAGRSRRSVIPSPTPLEAHPSAWLADQLGNISLKKVCLFEERAS